MKSLFVKTFIYVGLIMINLNAQSPVLIKDLNPGTASGIDEWVYKGIFFQGKYFMPANNGVNGLELFVLENDQLSLFKDIQIGSKGSSPQNFFVYHNKLYFTANDTVNGHEVWCTDGTPNGTQRLTSLAPKTDYSNPKGFIIGGDDKLYFSCLEKLYKSDGTSQGTSEVKGISSIELGENADASPKATAFESGLAVLINHYREKAVWLVNEKAEVKRIYSIQPNSEYDLLGLVNINNGLLFGFSNDLSTKNIGLYFYSAAEDTVRNIAPTIQPYRIEKLDDKSAIVKTLKDYYVTDGTANQTIAILKNADNSLIQGEPLNIVKCGSNWMFESHSSLGEEKVSITDGTLAGTKVAFNNKTYLSPMLQGGDYVFYITGYTNNFVAEISYFDCKKATTKLVYKASSGSASAPTYTPLFLLKDKYYFIGNIGKGREIYSINTGVIISNIDLEAPSPINLKQIADRTYKLEGEAKEYTISLYNTNGQIVLRKKVNSDETFELESEFFGLFILNISSGVVQSNIKLALY